MVSLATKPKCLFENIVIIFYLLRNPQIKYEKEAKQCLQILKTFIIYNILAGCGNLFEKNFKAFFTHYGQKYFFSFLSQ